MTETHKGFVIKCWVDLPNLVVVRVEEVVKKRHFTIANGEEHRQRGR